MTGSPADSDTDADKEALQHAWNWFSMHAAQRMQVVSYFLVIFALIIAGYGTSMQADNYVVAVGIAVTGIVITLSFLLLESRTRELVQAAEPALKKLEARLASRATLPELEIVAAVHKPRQRLRKYSFVIRALMWAAVLLMLVAAIVAFVESANDPAERSPSPMGHEPRHSQRR